MRRKSMRGTAVAMAVMLALTGFPAQSYAQDMFTDGEKTTEPLHLGGGAERLFSSDLSETEEQELLTDGEAVPDFSDAQEETAEEGRLLALNGEGTEENPYTVSSADELKSFREAVNNGDNFAGQYVQMTQDIDLEGEALGGPIGSVSNKSFAGTFDGKGYTIKGLNTSGGLFGYVGASSYDPGTICNLTVEGTVTSGAGNCTGGIVGRLNYGTIENCVSYVGVSGAAATGGVAGYAGSGAIVNKCFHSGDVRGTGNYVGGVVGQNYGTIRNCYHVNGTITGSRDYVGGVAGISSNMENCYSVGSVSGSRNVGGAIGKLSGTPEIKNVYYDSTVHTVGDNCAGVEGKTTEEFQSGEVAWLLNNGVTDGTQVYFQTCGAGTPAFEGETVYAVYEQQCPGMEPSGEVTYANTPGTVGEHQFVETAGEKYLKSAANCQSPAVYYKSCTYCGQASETEIFTSGEKNPDNHTGTIQWTTDATTHTGIYTCCNVSVASGAHQWLNGKCTVCGYVCQHTGGTATCEQRAVCELCGTSYGAYVSHETVKIQEKEATAEENGNIQYWQCENCGKYFRDRLGIEEIALEDTVIPKKETDQDTSIKVNGDAPELQGAGTWTDPYSCEYPYRRSDIDSLDIRTNNPYAVLTDSSDEEKGNSMTVSLDYGWNEISFKASSSDGTAETYYRIRWQRTKLERTENLTSADISWTPASNENSSDGKITGLDPEEIYLYRPEGETDWTEVKNAGEITGLAPGQYYVRYGESDTYLAQGDGNDHVAKVYIGVEGLTIPIEKKTEFEITSPSSASKGERVEFKIKLDESCFIEDMTIQSVYNPSSGWGSNSAINSEITGYESCPDGIYAIGFFIAPSSFNVYEGRSIVFESVVSTPSTNYYPIELEDSLGAVQEMKVEPDESTDEIVLDGKKVYKEGSSVTIRLMPDTADHIQEITGFSVKDSSGKVIAVAQGDEIIINQVPGTLTISDVQIKYEPADFTELESCLENVPDDESETAYTAESWKTFQEALEQVRQAVNESWGYDKQTELDERTEKLKAAVAALEFSSAAQTRIVTDEVTTGISGTNFDTAEKVKEELLHILEDAGYSAGRMVFYNVKIQFSADGGKTWVDATENNFPSNGALVTIPYPAGTGRYSHNFSVVQMFTVSSEKLNTTPGETANASVIKANNGIQVTMQGTSLMVGIAWKSVPAPVTPDPTPSPTPTVPEGYPEGTVVEEDGTIVVPDGTQVKPDGTIILPGEDLESTEDDIYVRKGQGTEAPVYNPGEGTATIHEGNTVTYPGEMLVTPADGSVISLIGTITAQDGTVITSDGVTHRTDGAEVAYDGTVLKAAVPIIRTVEVSGNKAKVILTEEAYGAQGYDFVISTNKNCIVDKDYDKVSKNITETETDFVYVQKEVYYAYCHSWIKGADGKKIFSGWSEPYRFEVTETTPAAPVIQKVRKNANGTITVTTVKGGPSYGYDIIFGTSLKKVNGEIRPVDYGNYVAKNRRKKTLTFPKLKTGTYYIAAHAFNRGENGKKVFSPWSNIKKIVVK